MARLLMVDLLQRTRDPSPEILDSIDAGLRYLEEAFDGGSGRFRNFRSDTGGWLDLSGTDDCLGRAVQGLGCAVRLAPDRARRLRAEHLLARAAPAAASVRAPRPMAYAILGCLDAALGGDDRYMTIAEDLAARSARSMADGRPDWPWPDDTVTYDNGVVPQALIRAGGQLGHDGWTESGVRCLDWLLAVQLDEGHLRPIGNRGWWARGGRPARFDQQPIEPASLLAAAAEASAATRDARWLDVVSRCFAWFLGANDQGAQVADPDDGSCRDGLEADGLNRNRGAESTLAWLMSVEIVARLASEPVD
jgi:hypothetical protein